LEEAKKTLEGELQVIHSQLEKDGYSSLAQMRCSPTSRFIKTFFNL
jgi:hypothetical protein